MEARAEHIPVASIIIVFIVVNIVFSFVQTLLQQKRDHYFILKKAAKSLFIEKPYKIRFELRLWNQTSNVTYIRNPPKESPRPVFIRRVGSVM